MQDKESVIVVRWELKIPSLGINVRHHSASLVMPNSYPRDGIFSPHLTTMKDSYNLTYPYPTRGVDKKRITSRVVNTLVVSWLFGADRKIRPRDPKQ